LGWGFARTPKPLDKCRRMCDNEDMTVRRGERCAVLGGRDEWGVCVWSNPIKHTVCIEYTDGTTVTVPAANVLH
jgi:hypothetical protein